ncbi:cytochrome c oxidase assembly protein cox19 [Pycnococcus provasolii]|uniref:Cytochrome c oxidase assembly protein COX19 n=1 Tax=Pycnococcus provasolii TaxID=41880 RepID=A0A830HGY0_9CHLO|nr:cytochrome c oxidase assembly protein cox19 [Pycnococcus provasolii]|mmetsp:Transcript_7543/g.17097  ORF Transcript_7543/g.17097 Transcript_7543/m.17097 type:complete len:116 (-) Transcript_7543:885-1232(-)|eukprot:CAMPEP_0198709666 /NCGR_PEP_ID=MMETSP1471-20131121/1985_1 /TAXON_ID=41880 /ORGANISM="Pycnococcus provasolii, Strain RCC733" /LENGTH=115 /DNA_ID=CAMNT_0044469103 /DNA_START=106 /DNA_END=453 /DNA_ORIENTATION=-
MSASSMSSGKIARPVPPEKGVFPLDHFGDCKSSKATYLTCLRQNNNDYDACVALSQAYLECRMKKELMAQQDLQSLGFADHNDPAKRSETGTPKEQDRTKHREGFVAGLHTVNRK